MNDLKSYINFIEASGNESEHSPNYRIVNQNGNDAAVILDQLTRKEVEHHIKEGQSIQKYANRSLYASWNHVYKYDDCMAIGKAILELESILTEMDKRNKFLMDSVLFIQNQIQTLKNDFLFHMDYAYDSNYFKGDVSNDIR